MLPEITHENINWLSPIYVILSNWLYRTMRELVCARSVTARIFTAREGAEQHCQVGNSALAREEIVRWLARFYPDMPSTKT
jgi:hypothetical protein